MKLLVMSDNHGRWQTVNELLDTFGPKVDYVIHCGDSEFPADDPVWEKVSSVVSGNMDFDPAYRDEYTIQTDMGNILVVHGHRHGVNHSYDALINYAQTHNIQFIFHGHTHRLHAEMNQGVFICNPGSLNHSRGQYDVRTFAIVTILSKEIEVDFYDDLGEIQPYLNQKFSLKEG